MKLENYTILPNATLTQQHRRALSLCSYILSSKPNLCRVYRFLVVTTAADAAKQEA